MAEMVCDTAFVILLAQWVGIFFGLIVGYIAGFYSGEFSILRRIKRKEALIEEQESMNKISRQEKEGAAHALDASRDPR